jgi:glycosyltransferase involved in cell wall biosynthesis
MPPPRLAILADFPEEGWPSMDLCGDMLLAHLPPAFAAERVCPPFRRAATRLPVVGRRNPAFNADRLLNRFLVFPRHARRAAPRFDLFHVVDHTYAQLVHALPAGRVGVYCHDLDAFRCVLEPASDPRPRWFRALARRALRGLRHAAVVFHNSARTGAELRRLGAVDPAKLVHAPLGVAAEFTADAGQPEPAPPADLAGRPWLLHVGSCIPRKRVDVLLDVFAAVRESVPDLRLVKVGGDWSAAHRERIARHGLAPAITHLHNLSRRELAELYRRAGAVLVPSAAEGFGLPVAEALACGAAVVASDIPGLREAGGPAALYAPVADVAAWAAAARRVLTDPHAAPPREARLAHARQFTWAAHAETVARAYHDLLPGGR